MLVNAQKAVVWGVGVEADGQQIDVPVAHPRHRFVADIFDIALQIRRVAHHHGLVAEELIIEKRAYGGTVDGLVLIEMIAGVVIIICFAFRPIVMIWKRLWQTWTRIKMKINEVYVKPFALLFYLPLPFARIRIEQER